MERPEQILDVLRSLSQKPEMSEDDFAVANELILKWGLAETWARFVTGLCLNDLVEQLESKPLAQGLKDALKVEVSKILAPC